METLAAMSRYEAYKDSGVEWLGYIPTHWRVTPLKYVAEIQTGNTPSKNSKHFYSEESGLPWVKPDELNDFMEILSSKDNLTERGIAEVRVISEGSVLVCCIGTIGKLGVAGTRLATNQQINSISFIKNVDPNFGKYLIYAAKNEHERLANGNVVKILNTHNQKSIQLPNPCRKEQRKIANFLDQKTAQIDEAIAIKEKQIELLKERKQIIIQKAVTQGLNPNVPMKESGVDWIGEIPEHWRVLRFKNIFEQSRLPVRKEDGVVTSYRDGQVTLRSNRRIGGYTEAIIEGGYQGIRKGQLVLNSMDAFEGAIGVSESDGKCTPEYVICNPKLDGVSQDYFALLLREMALAKYIQVICNAVRQRAVRIRFNNLASRFVVFPPKNEQDEVVAYVQRESQQIDDGISHLTTQIDKLKEYKTTLINSAVTGKIKVS